MKIIKTDMACSECHGRNNVKEIFIQLTENSSRSFRLCENCRRKLMRLLEGTC